MYYFKTKGHKKIEIDNACDVIEAINIRPFEDKVDVMYCRYENLSRDAEKIIVDRNATQLRRKKTFYLPDLINNITKTITNEDRAQYPDEEVEKKSIAEITSIQKIEIQKTKDVLNG